MCALQQSHIEHNVVCECNASGSDINQINGQPAHAICTRITHTHHRTRPSHRRLSPLLDCATYATRHPVWLRLRHRQQHMRVCCVSGVAVRSCCAALPYTQQMPTTFALVFRSPTSWIIQLNYNISRQRIRRLDKS